MTDDHWSVVATERGSTKTGDISLATARNLTYNRDRQHIYVDNVNGELLCKSTKKMLARAKSAGR